MNGYGIHKLIQLVSLGIHFSLAAIKYVLLYPVSQHIYINRSVWLIAERGMEARDNGYHMFRYIRTNHPDIEAYYIIAEDSTDRERV